MNIGERVREIVIEFVGEAVSAVRPGRAVPGGGPCRRPGASGPGSARPVRPRGRRNVCKAPDNVRIELLERT